MGFIYKVTNCVNSKVYIGQTNFSIETRFKQHLRDCDNKCNENRPLYLAMKKYGKENFHIELIEECSSDKLNEREKYWISYYNSFNEGYNATVGGDGKQTHLDYDEIKNFYLSNGSKAQTCKHFNCSMDTVNKVCEMFNIETISNCGGRKIIRIDLNGNEIEFLSIRQAAEKIALEQNKNPQTVRKRITEIINHKQNEKGYGYYWKLS